MAWNRRDNRFGRVLLTAILALIVIQLLTQLPSYQYIGKTGECSRNHCHCVDDFSRRYSFENLTMISRRNAVKIQRIWENELSQINKSLNDETIEWGGQPERILLVSTWKSGSSYVGSILRSRPATHYFFEPLHSSYEEFEVRTESQVRKALSILHDLFHCRDQEGRHITKLTRNDSFFSRNPKLFAIAHRYNIRWDPIFCTLMCRKSPALSMKTVRLPLRHASTLLEYKELNIKLIYLVRDPQETTLSRLKERWCEELPACAHLSSLCTDLLQNYEVAKELEEKYPTRFMVLRFEDLLTRSRTANQLVQFLNMSKDALLPVKSPKKKRQLTTDTARKFHKIQEDCAKAMELWGYKSLPKNSVFTIFKTLHNSTTTVKL